jgi:hypothetical protein
MKTGRINIAEYVLLEYIVSKTIKKKGLPSSVDKPP